MQGSACLPTVRRPLCQNPGGQMGDSLFYTARRGRRALHKNHQALSKQANILTAESCPAPLPDHP